MTIRTALIGLGWSGQQIWLPRLTAADGYEVVAAADADPARRSAFTVATGRPAVAGPEELDADSVDLAVVAVPNHLHAPMACALLRRGVATFVEKPVCLTSAEADTLAVAERCGGAPLLAGSAARHRADVAALRALLPDLGAVRTVDVGWLRASGVPRPGGWFTNRRLAGGGVLVDLGWHLLDVLEYLTGAVEFRQVTAVTSDDRVNAPAAHAAWREDTGAACVPVDVEDTVRGFMVTGSGVGVGLAASWASAAVTHDTTTVHVVGTAATATLRCTFGFSPHRVRRPGITLVGEGRVTDVPVPEEPVGIEYDRLLDEIRDRLADPPAPGTAVAGVRRVVRAVEAIYAAAGRPPERREAGDGLAPAGVSAA